MISKRLQLASIALLSACAAIPSIPRLPGERITIEYTQGPFCGSCDKLTIIANSDGKAIWEHGFWQGRYEDWTTYRYPVRISRQQFADVREALASVRPLGERWLRIGGDKDGTRRCEVEYSDMPERKIKWESAERTDVLWVDLGCDPKKNAALFEMLRTIPSRLGIHPNFRTEKWVASTRTD